MTMGGAKNFIVTRSSQGTQFIYCYTIILIAILGYTLYTYDKEFTANVCLTYHTTVFTLSCWAVLALFWEGVLTTKVTWR